MFIRNAAILAALIGLVALSGCGSLGYTACATAEKPEDMGRNLWRSPAPQTTGGLIIQREAEQKTFPLLPTKLSDDATGEPVMLSAATTHPARIIIYSGSVRLVVSDIASTIESIRRMAVGMGGYLDHMDSKSITVRVPADKFDAALQDVQSRGEVAFKQIKASDVTEEMQDLGIRLANARQTRQRLLDHLDKSTKMEDTLKIEAELERVTRELELFEGKIRYLQEQIAFSLLEVELNSPVPQAQLVVAVPFPWVRELGQGLVTGGSPQQAQQSGWFDGGVNFELPPGYIRFYQHDDLTEAMSADGVMIKATRHDNYKGGDIKFWSTLARRALLNNGSIAVKGESTLKPTAALIEGTKNLPGGDQGYLLLLIISSDHVEAYEAWGPKAMMDRDHDILRKAGESLAK